MGIRAHPYNLLLLTAILLFIFFLFINENQTLDVHLPDTYFVIAGTHFFWLFALLLSVLWIAYRIFKKILFSLKLTWIHVLISVMTTILLLLFLFIGNYSLNLRPGSYTDSSSWNTYHENFTQKMRTISYGILVLLVAQMVFVANLIIGLFKRIANR